MKSINILEKIAFKNYLFVLLPTSWLVGVYFYLEPNYKPWLFQISSLQCPLLKWFALKCPLCGLGHALIHAWTLDLNASFVAHPLGLLIYAFSWTWLISSLFKSTKMDSFLNRFRSFANSIPAIYWGLGLISITITRNLL